jgi:hypothetical protein
LPLDLVRPRSVRGNREVYPHALRNRSLRELP